MQVLDVFKLSVKALMNRKTRSLITILGVMAGSALILALIASGNGTTASVQAQVQKIGANTLIVRAASANFVSGSTSAYQLTSQDVSTLSHLSHVQKVVPYYSKSVSISVGGQTISGTLIGVDPTELPQIYKGLSLAAGALPSSYDPTSATIGYGIAYPATSTSQLIGLNQAVSMKIGSSTTGLTFLVKGILNEYGSALFTNIDNCVFVSFNAAQLLLKTPYFSAMYVIIDSTTNVASVQTAINSLYNSNGVNEVNIISAGSIANSLSSITGGLTTLMASIGAISLVVAASNNTNTMMMAVKERTKEIGILKALGYTRRQIMVLFMAESVLIGIAGGILGTLLGVALAYSGIGTLNFGGGGGGGGGRGGGGFASVFSSGSSGPVFSTGLIVFSLTFPILITILAGIYPSWQAARMKPVDALKYE